MVARTRADAACKDAHLHGFARLSSSLKLFVALASASAFIPDAYLQLIECDDRLVRQHDDLRRALDEVTWPHSLPQLVWQRLVLFCGDEHSGTVRDMALQCALTTASYINMTVLQPLTE